MQEKSFFFPGSSGNLFGVLHTPGEQKTKKCGFVFCAPFAEEKLWSHRVYTNFARKLAGHGYTVLRFDYLGHGDSDGEFRDTTVDSRIIDIKSALHTLRQEGAVEDVGLLGLRFGATLAALVAEETSVCKLILWGPVLNGAQYMKTLIRTNISTQISVFKEVRDSSSALVEKLRSFRDPIIIEGYEITLPLYEQIVSIDLLSTEKKFTGDVLLLDIVKKEGMENEKMKLFEQMYPHITIGPVVEKQFWKEIREYYYSADNLFESTLNWMENKYELNSSND